ncbi:MAG TPA: hypothetical protein P5232_00315 [Candidatus Moranbacteria bacterium]|nr:hypothetical protein [Candidatus Moranbacteria bacterium]
MYWIFLIIFILTVIIPDVVRTNFYFVSEERLEEVLIFLMGAMAFIIFMKNEQQLIFHKKEKEKDEKKIEQTVKDLVESYSYIGEVNRKMDILMNIALGLSDRSVLDTTHEKETYQSIVSASSFLLKADCTALRFVNTENFKTKTEFRSEEKGKVLKNSALADMKENLNVKRYEDCLIVSSGQKINQIRSYLIICGFDEEEEKNPKNMEILKVFASQALFLYSYTHTNNKS